MVVSYMATQTLVLNLTRAFSAHLLSAFDSARLAWLYHPLAA
jgi:hypothetical protein